MHDLTALIGHTPLVRLSRIPAPADILLKLEGMNPGGSAKDRAALAMVDDVERRGLLSPGGTIIEPTSGNMGVSLAMIASARGYRCILVMPDSMSVERRRLLTAYGAQADLVDGRLGMAGCVAHAEDIHKQSPGSVILGQFRNPANPAAHERTTGPEILADTLGKVDAFVAGIGTGGTISGAGHFLRQHVPGVRIVGAEPAESPLLTAGWAGSHGIQGIGANFVPEVLDRTLLDEVIPVPDQAAAAMARLLARQEGILAGISSGAAVWAALRLAHRPGWSGKTIVALLPDRGERYLSTGIFD